MHMPESKVISIAAVAAEDLWQRTVADIPELDNLRLSRRLRLLDKLTQRLFEGAFGQTARGRHASLSDTAIANTGTHDYIIGYDNSERNMGLRQLTASWGEDSWALQISLYHLAGYHRLDEVTIKHQDQQVSFVCPERFLGRIVPANTLPTDIEIKSAA